MSEDEQLEADANEAIAEQTVVTKLTTRKASKIHLTPHAGELRLELSPSQVGILHAAYGILDLIQEHATDESYGLAAEASPSFAAVTECYPVEWVEPKKPKPK